MVMKPELASFDLIIEHQLSPVIFSFHSLFALVKALKKYPKKFKQYLINLKIDTGMHRLGFNSDEVPELIQELKKHPNIKIEGVFSHLAASDQPEHDELLNNKLTCLMNYLPHSNSNLLINLTNTF
jgi:alanine racemase